MQKNSSKIFLIQSLCLLNFFQLISADSHWTARRFIVRMMGIQAKGETGEVLMNHSEKVKWQEITVLGSYSLQQVVDLSPRTLVVQCPSDSFLTEILNPCARELTGFILAEVPTPVPASYEPGNRVLLHRCDHQVPTPGVREYSQKRETDVNPVAFAVCAHYSHSDELCVTGPEHVRGRRDLRGRCGICADPPGTRSLLHSSVIPWCLSEDRGVLQRCGWWETIVAPVESTPAQSA